MATDFQGRFEVIESFYIASRNEFYLIGQLKEGDIQENWFVNVILNSSLSLSIRIKALEEIEMASDRSTYKLVIIDGKDDSDILLSLRIGSELVTITIDGAD
jgi:hypothetical protein